MKEKDYRIRKFNSGAGAILCNGCGVIVMDGFIEFLGSSFTPKFSTFDRITKEDWDSKEPIYCEVCKKKLNIGI